MHEDGHDVPFVRIVAESTFASNALIQTLADPPRISRCLEERHLCCRPRTLTLSTLEQECRRPQQPSSECEK
eukprot:887769-Amphidinium_carterae.1